MTSQHDKAKPWQFGLQSLFSIMTMAACVAAFGVWTLPFVVLMLALLFIVSLASE